MRRPLVGAVIGAVVLVSLPAGAGGVEGVEVRDVSEGGFFPDVVSTHAYNGGSEGTVRWFRAEGSYDRHNVAEVNGIFRSGDPTFGEIDFTRRFSAGKFDYLCEFHGPIMSGVIKARLLLNPDPDGLPFTVRWAHQGTGGTVRWAHQGTGGTVRGAHQGTAVTTNSNTGDVFDVRYKVDDGQWDNWKTDTETNKGVFGRDGKPDEVSAGHTYRFQARSQKSASTPNAHSRWSPVLAVAT